MAEDDNPFESPRLLLAGAARHIATLEAKLIELRQRDWMVPESDGDGGIVVKPIVKIPPEMKQIAYDIANNLRSALDHAVYASAYTLLGHDGDGTKFPIGDTADDVASDAKRRCKKVPPEIVELLLTFEPHRQGNPIIWGLNKLRNTKSHRVLVPVAASINLVGQGPPSDGASASFEWDQVRGFFKPKLQLAPGTKIGGVSYNFRLEVLIGTGAFRGEAALGIFNRMASEVERIVTAIEAETTRLVASRS